MSAGLPAERVHPPSPRGGFPGSYPGGPLLGCVLGLVAGLAPGGCHPGEAPLFEHLPPERTGVSFANTIVEDDSVYNPLVFDYVYNGGGVAASDLNGDGLVDLFFTGNQVSSRLYLNRGDFRFVDVTERAGLTTTAWINGVAAGDVNDDGHTDLYLSVGGDVNDDADDGGRANLLFINDGPGPDGVPTFTETAHTYGLADTGVSTQAAFLDYDRDGDLDLFVLANSVERQNKNALRPRLRRGESASTDRLYRNNGDGTFTDVSLEAGITFEGYGLGVVVSDLNRDGWPDIYCANDFLTNDLVYVNNGDGTFTNRAAEYLDHQTHNGMGVDAADYNNDTRVDIVVLDMLPPDRERLMTMLPGRRYAFDRSLRELGYEPQYMRNTLQLNNGPPPEGGLSFSEIGRLAGIDATDWSWAALFADFDNDGLKDLFVTNGYRRDVTNLDFIVANRQSGMIGTPETRRRRLFERLATLPEVRLPNVAYRNRGDLTFTDRTGAWGLDAPGFSNGAAYADLDNDGDLDLVVNNINAPASVYRNHAGRQPGRHALQLRLLGPSGNRDGLGTRVTAHARDTVRYVEQSPVRGYLSSVDPRLHIGLGSAERVDSLVVVWPDGRRQALRDVPADQLLTLRHTDADTAPLPAPTDPLPWFTAAPNAPAFVHTAPHDDPFAAAPLLPHPPHPGGPPIAVGDVDGDGRDDVYLGGGAGQYGALFLQTAAGTFAPAPPPDAPDATAALLFDADADADLDLLVTLNDVHPNDGTGPDDSPGAPPCGSRLFLNDGHGRFTLAPEALPPDAGGPVVAAGDFDRDGDLDLFVGGRTLPDRYPLAAPNALLRNETREGRPGVFTDVTARLAPTLAPAGLVRAALWTDIDRDDALDLLVAGDWMPITLFRGHDGRFERVVEAAGLGDTAGWWNSLAGADFDADGDIDIVAGNRGLNTPFAPAPDAPARLYAADFDRNGRSDPVLTIEWQGTRYPYAVRDLLIAQIPGMARRFETYGSYARAPFDRVLTPDELKGAYVVESTLATSSYLENQGSGHFAVRPLPVQAQFSPVFGLQPGDYDGDGHLDLLFAGNLYAADALTGQYDASIGGVLAGDGRGGFRFIPLSESGFFVDGDARGLAEIRLAATNRTLVLAARHGGALRAFQVTPQPDRPPPGSTRSNE